MFFELKLPGTPKCYAHLLGGCSRKISREHVFTGAVMGSGGPIGMQGFANRPDSMIGLSSAVAKVLCTAHNSLLSNLDKEANELSDKLVEFISGKFAGHVTVDGPRLERWLLKVTLGYLAAGHTPLGHLYARSVDVVRALFGEIPMAPPIGMSSMVDVDRSSDRPREVLFRELVAIDPDNNSRCVGAFIALHGLPFLFSFGGPFPIDSYLVKPDGSSYLDPYDCTNARTRFHPDLIRFQSDQSTELTVNFNWP